MKNLTEFKTTIIGAVLFLTGIYLFIDIEDYSVVELIGLQSFVIGFLIFIGSILLFSKDRHLDTVFEVIKLIIGLKK